MSTLQMLCGKIAAGKSTLAAELASNFDTILVSEDKWLSVLFGEQMATVSDYIKYAAKFRRVMGPHVKSLLNAGVSVVLDFPANTIEDRAWMRKLLDGTGARHQLHYLEVSDEECLNRLLARNEMGTHAFSATKEQFEQVTRHFVPPSPAEGFTVVIHRSGSG